MTSGVPVSSRAFALEFAPEVLSRLGSPSIPEKEARKELTRLFHTDASHRATAEFVVADAHVACANEVFPEATHADPLADIRLWLEWRGTARGFVFPGSYAKLEISDPATKRVSSASMGALGEILAGLFLQEYIAPIILVRPIGRWPDFIAYRGEDRYVFVEAKAFTGPDFREATRQSAAERIPSKLLGEAGLHAVRQLNADPFVEVCYVFVEIQGRPDLCCDCTIVRFDAPEDLRSQRRAAWRIPDAVVESLAERAVSSALALPEVRHLLEVLLKNRRLRSHFPWAYSRRRYADDDAEALATEFEETIAVHARRVLEDVLRYGCPEHAYAAARQAVERAIDELANRLSRAPSNYVGQSFAAAKRDAAKGLLASIRELPTGDHIFLVDMPPSRIKELIGCFVPDLGRCSRPELELRDRPFWRCSEVLLGIGPPGFLGIPIEEHYRRRDTGL